MHFLKIKIKKEEKAIFLYGFGKNEKPDIDKAELQYFKKLGSDLLAIDAKQITGSTKKQILFEPNGICQIIKCKSIFNTPMGARKKTSNWCYTSPS